MFSKKLEYGYLILKFLKDTNELKLKSGKEIIESTKIPYNMGLSILTELSTGNLIKSIKGKNGGFYRENKDITLLDLFQVLENKKIIKTFSNSEYEKEVLRIGVIVLEKMNEIII